MGHGDGEVMSDGDDKRGELVDVVSEDMAFLDIKDYLLFRMIMGMCLAQWL